MADPTPSYSIPINRNLIQIKRKIITVSDSSIVIRKGVHAKMIKEKQIFTKSKIHFLISIGEKSDDKAFFLALSSKRIALFQLKNESPISIFKLDEKIVDHGTVEVLDMGMRKEGEFRVRLIIPIAFYSGTVRKMQVTVDFDDSQIIKQKIKCLEELGMEDEKMRFCVDLGNGNFFGFYEDSVVKSNGLVSRVEEPSTLKNRRIAVVARELWQGNILLATENGTIRVVSAKDGGKIESDSLSIFSEGQCVPPYCTLRCREPSVLISSENTVIVGTARGEIHFFNERLQLICKIDTEGGPINCLKVDENDIEYLLVGFESGELRMLFMPDSEQNENKDISMDLHHAQSNDDEERSDNEAETPKKNKGRQLLKQSKKSETDLECLEKGCYYTTRSVYAFILHLRKIHRTTLALAGVVFRCECGNESIGELHSRKCDISNFTVIRKHDFGPTRTFADKMTPQCVLCKVYPTTVLGYAHHLKIAHQNNLDEIGCYLKCGVCLEDFYNYNQRRLRSHPKKCKGRIYTLVKIKYEVEKKDKTEMDQTTDA